MVFEKKIGNRPDFCNILLLCILPVLKSAVNLRRANSFSSMANLFITLTYSWTLQMVVVTKRTLWAVNFSCWTEVCKWLTMVLKMLDKFMLAEH